MNPRLSPRVRLRFEPDRSEWLLLWPERGVQLNDGARAIVRLCDGTRTVEEIVDKLAEDWSAPRETLQRDVDALLARLAARGLLVS